MRHRKAGVKLNRTTSHRQAMFRNMVTSLFKHERIRTTDVKAKELRRWAERIITLAKRGDLHARRQVMAIMQEKDVVHKLFENAAKRFGAMNGGYTRIIKIGRRPGDAAPISLIELMAAEPKSKPKKKSKGAAKKKEAAPAAAPAAPSETSAETQTADSGVQADEKPEAPEAEAQVEPAVAADETPQSAAESTEAAAAPDAVPEGVSGEDPAAPAEENAQDAEEPKDK
jgi:large subunit ribosomal protein L17